MFFCGPPMKVDGAYSIAVSKEQAKQNEGSLPFMPSELELNKIVAYNKNGEIVAIFNSYSEAARECNLNHYNRVARNINPNYIDCNYNGESLFSEKILIVAVKCPNLL